MTGPPALRPSPRFGEFEFAPGLRRLQRGGAVVELSSRAVDILAVLTERPGEVITKQELLARVWPDAVVVEAALRFHMVALRRALGDGEGGGRFITTASGRGYCFVGELESPPDAAESAAAPSRATPRPLPARPAKVVGRDAVVEDLIRQLERQRFVTIVGPGGIGKTTVALVAAHDWVAMHGGVAVFIDLGDLAPESPESVAEALCVTLGLVPQDISPTESAIAHLQTSKALIVLDTCEGVIEAAARLAESLVASAPGVRVFATSRESLRAEGELVHRIEPLAAPVAGPDLMAREALTYPAVQLFVQRVAANHLGFELSDQQAGVVGAICRELDGMALAIELAAGRVEAFGIQQVADLLATEFALTWPGRRTAAPRQQTLRATLNWSYELLAPIERVVFCRLSALAGAFPLEAAIAVGADDAGLPATDVVGALTSLVAKSLLNAVTEGSANHFRMLDTTRSYALAKLAESSDERARACKHLNRLLREYTENSGRQFLRQFGYDLEAAGATYLGMSEFLRGNLDKALSANDRAIAKARTLSSPVSLGAVLRWRATMMYFFDEDGLEVDRLTREVLPTEAFFYADNRPEGNSLAVHGLWLARNGEWVHGTEMVRQGLKACIDADYLYILSLVRAEIALQLLRHGAGEQIDEFTAPLEDDDQEDGWSTPEVLRIRGEIAERRGDLVLAETRYREALVLAERQDALTWRLRAAISLANLWLNQDRAEDAAALLAPIREQFRSGADWPLLRRAAGCLSVCRAASESLPQTAANF
ncbi:MAG: transcriptional regulator [Caulobacteraceae bacterium]|nr:transcriptional regulator [Caulobacteraceae bacterium]